MPIICYLMKFGSLILSLIFFNIVLCFLIVGKYDNRLVFLDVGQGDSTLSILKDSAYLIDTGPKGNVVRNIGRYLGLRKYIDVVFVTHYDLDHYGGITELVKRYKIGVLVFPSVNGKSYPSDMSQNLFEAMSSARNQDTRIVAVKSGVGIDFTDERLEIISPDKDFKLNSDNDNSLVIYAIAKDKTVLFTADIGKEAEEMLVNKYGKSLKAEILKVSHHGSKSSSDENFLKTVMPQTAIISVGNNFYGHPAKEILLRLLKNGAKIRRTDQEGDIIIEK